jgi:hypothetical protein
MAIKIRLRREQNAAYADLQEAYLKIHDVTICLRAAQSVRIDLAVYQDETARQMGEEGGTADKHTIKTTLAQFVALGQPVGWERKHILAAAYRFLVAAKKAGTAIDFSQGQEA